MKKMYCLVMALLVIGSLMAKQPKFQLKFGNGGGFTGLKTTYVLGSDGTLVKEQNIGDKKEILKKVKKKDIKKITKLIQSANFPSLKIDNTGNMTNFVQLTMDGKDYKTQWSGMTSGNGALDELYKTLIALISKK
jgi:hypothetical protein